MFNLEESDVVAVTTHEPGGQQATQYFYEFLELGRHSPMHRPRHRSC